MGGSCVISASNQLRSGRGFEEESLSIQSGMGSSRRSERSELDQEMTEKATIFFANSASSMRSERSVDLSVFIVVKGS